MMGRVLHPDMHAHSLASAVEDLLSGRLGRLRANVVLGIVIDKRGGLGVLAAHTDLVHCVLGALFTAETQLTL